MTFPLSKCQNFRCFGVLPGWEFAAWKSVHNWEFRGSEFSDFKRLVGTFKINTQKYNWPRKTCKPINNEFQGSNWNLMRTERSEVCDKAWLTKFCVFFTTLGVVANLWFFGALKKNYFKKKILNFWFFVMCHINYFRFCSILVDIPS